MRMQGDLDLVKQRPKKKGLTLIGALHIYRPCLHQQALHDPECAVLPAGGRPILFGLQVCAV